MTEDTYQKTTPSQEDGKNLEEKSTQTLGQHSHMSGRTDTQDTSGSILTSKKVKNVVVPVKGLKFNLIKG